MIRSGIPALGPDPGFSKRVLKESSWVEETRFWKERRRIANPTLNGRPSAFLAPRKADSALAYFLRSMFVFEYTTMSSRARSGARICRHNAIAARAAARFGHRRVHQEVAETEND